MVKTFEKRHVFFVKPLTAEFKKREMQGVSQLRFVTIREQPLIVEEES
jgi:hypothetical protein